MLAGVFTLDAIEEGTWRWGHRLRPMKELAYAGVTYILAGVGTGLADRLTALGCKGTICVVSPEDPGFGAPEAELDWLRRAQARDLADDQISAIQARLPVLAQLDPERAWLHRYDAAKACERVNLAAAALELYREVTENATDQALAMRAAFHTARLLIARGALHQAAPLLAKILKNNPGHRAAKTLFDEVTRQELSA
jgi:tetratricopeptide (TPR) repeat protein